MTVEPISDEKLAGLKGWGEREGMPLRKTVRALITRLEKAERERDEAKLLFEAALRRAYEAGQRDMQKEAAHAAELVALAGQHPKEFTQGVLFAQEAIIAGIRNLKLKGETA